MTRTLHLRIAGRVQGVGYRAALQATAQDNAITGWVRNRRDGTVEAVLQGNPAGVERVLSWARRGPPSARVTDLKVEAAEGEFDRPYSGFDCLPSA